MNEEGSKTMGTIVEIHWDHVIVHYQIYCAHPGRQRLPIEYVREYFPNEDFDVGDEIPIMT